MLRHVRFWVSFLLLLIIMTGSWTSTAKAMVQPDPHTITEWEVLWETNDNRTDDINSVILNENWTNVNLSTVNTSANGHTSAWIRFRIPDIKLLSPSLYIEKMYAQSYWIYIGDQLINSSQRDYTFEMNEILLPVGNEDLGKMVYIKLENVQTRLGISQKGISLGEHSALLTKYTNKNMLDLVLGGTYLLMSFIMLIVYVFMRKLQSTPWVSLTLVLFSIGTLTLTYSPSIYIYYGELGGWYVFLFEIGLYTLFPSLCYFFENVFGPGKYGIVKKYRIVMSCYSALCLSIFIIDNIWQKNFSDVYYIFTVIGIGVLMLIELLILLILSFTYTFKGSKNALIFSLGFAVFAIIGIIELSLFFTMEGNYDLFYWKWGIFAFILALIIIVAKQFAANHEQLIQYSQELELHNNQIQRAEKFQIISDLAAAVAHEVRNPLQVTRGFLQLLIRKTNHSDRKYMDLAVEELDRATSIITDFLTFAKPQLDNITKLNLKSEFELIEGIMAPMANLQAVQLSVIIPEDLWIMGNSAKLKQAFINIIKNSIEAINNDGGLIKIITKAYYGEVKILIIDNGEGMEPDALTKLGEPYFSTKTKGTGLGLMVTYRIIEVMGGTIHFNSTKGLGTEAIITFPLIVEGSV